MTEPADLDGIPQATVVPKKHIRFSVVWILPILVAVVAIGIAIQRVLSEGPTITMIFKAAEGIEAGKTFIKYKDVDIGRVTAVRLGDDYAKVEVKAKIIKSAAGLMVDDAKFWIVRPRVSLSGISGLSTLLSGNYIGFDAGTSANTQRSFTALDVPPISTGKPGRQFVLNAKDLDSSLQIGSPIYYRHVPVGQVVAYDLTADGKAVQVKVFVNAPYDKYVTSGTRFWNASGLDVSLNANGVDLRTESLVSMLVGGLSFDTPSFVSQAADVAANTGFTLYGDRATAMKAPDTVAKHYVLYFRESLQGLTVGAPVTFLGLPAGEVTSIGLSLDAAKTDIRPRVVVTLYPERLIAYASTGQEARTMRAEDNDAERQLLLKRLIEQRGLRAQLRSANLISGQLYVAFDYFRDASKVKINLSEETPELPVVPGRLVNLEAKLGSILDKVDKLPIEAIGSQLKNDLEDFDETLQAAKKLLNDVNVELVPELKTDLEALRRTLAAVERAMNSADTTLLGADAPAQQELRAALQEFTRAARSLRAMTDYLERHPESLLRGKTEPTRAAN